MGIKKESETKAIMDISKTILVVEDDEDLNKILVEILRPICDTILTATNGVEAIALMKTCPNLCAVISDIAMPQMDGLELLSQIRSSFNPVPFVILTGYGESKHYEQAIKLNATDFLTKPFEPEMVTLVMHRALLYGFGLIQVERKLDEIYRDSGIAEDKLFEIKRVKRTVMAMRIESSLYTPKKA